MGIHAQPIGVLGIQPEIPIRDRQLLLLLWGEFLVAAAVDGGVRSAPDRHPDAGTPPAGVEGRGEDGRRVQVVEGPGLRQHAVDLLHQERREGLLRLRALRRDPAALGLPLPDLL